MTVSSQHLWRMCRSKKESWRWWRLCLTVSMKRHWKLLWNWRRTTLPSCGRCYATIAMASASSSDFCSAAVERRARWREDAPASIRCCTTALRWDGSLAACWANFTPSYPTHSCTPERYACQLHLWTAFRHVLFCECSQTLFLIDLLSEKLNLSKNNFQSQRDFLPLCNILNLLFVYCCYLSTSYIYKHRLLLRCVRSLFVAMSRAFILVLHHST